MTHQTLRQAGSHYRMTLSRVSEEIIRIVEGDRAPYAYTRKIRKQRIPTRLYQQATAYNARKWRQLNP